jgi:hypothetical protein
MPGAVVTGTLNTSLLALTNTGFGGGLYGATNGPSASGVFGLSGSSGPGVYGTSVGGPGVQGNSTNSHGVYGVTGNANSAGVFGFHVGGGIAIRGENSSSTNAAIYGANSGSGPSIVGQGTSNTGVAGNSTSGFGVRRSSAAAQQQQRHGCERA